MNLQNLFIPDWALVSSFIVFIVKWIFEYYVSRRKALTEIRRKLILEIFEITNSIEAKYHSQFIGKIREFQDRNDNRNNALVFTRNDFPQFKEFITKITNNSPLLGAEFGEVAKGLKTAFNNSFNQSLFLYNSTMIEYRNRKITEDEALVIINNGVKLNEEFTNEFNKLQSHMKYYYYNWWSDFVFIKTVRKGFWPRLRK